MIETTENAVLAPQYAECPRHGVYQVETLPAPFPGCKPVRLRCRDCREEAAAAEHERRANAELGERLRRARIPEEYLGKGLGTFPTTTAAQREVVDGCRWYLREFEHVRDAAPHGSWIVFIGPPGTGKTGLGCSVLQGLAQMGRRPLYHTVASMRRWVWDARNRQSSDSAATEELFSVDVLFIDELGSTTAGDAELALLVEVITERYMRRKPLLLATNLQRTQLQQLVDARIYSRLQQRAAFVVCAWPDLRLLDLEEGHAPA